jgi:hypothetical protein
MLALGHEVFDADTTPPSVEARLLLAGYGTREFLVMTLDGEWQGRAAVADVRPCSDASGWSAYDALKRDDWRESALRMGLSEGSVGDPVVIVAAADDTPRLAYARMGFRPVAVSRAYLRRVSAAGSSG